MVVEAARGGIGAEATRRREIGEKGQQAGTSGRACRARDTDQGSRSHSSVKQLPSTEKKRPRTCGAFSRGSTIATSRAFSRGKLGSLDYPGEIAGRSPGSPRPDPRARSPTSRGIMGRTAVGVRGSPGRSVAPRSSRTWYPTALEAKWIHITELRRLCRRAHLAPAESQYNTRADSRRGLSLLLAANPGEGLAEVGV